VKLHKHAFPPIGRHLSASVHSTPVSRP